MCEEDPRIERARTEEPSVAVTTLTEVIEDDTTKVIERVNGHWFRAFRYRRIGLDTNDIPDKVSSYQLALQDRASATNTCPFAFLGWFEERFGKTFGLPEQKWALPVYQDYFQKGIVDDGFGGNNLPRFATYSLNAIRGMNREGLEAIPMLERLAEYTDNPGGPPWEHGGRQVKAVVKHLTRLRDGIPPDENAAPDDNGGLDDVNTLLWKVQDDRWPDTEFKVQPDDVTQEPELLKEQLESDDLELRVRAAGALFCIYETPKTWLVPLFEEMAKTDPKRDARLISVAALARWGNNTEFREQVIETLVAVVKRDGSYIVRGLAAEGLGEFAPGDESARQAIEACLSRSRNGNQRKPLVKAIAKFGPAASKSLPAVIQFEPHRRDEVAPLNRAETILRIADPQAVSPEEALELDKAEQLIKMTVLEGFFWLHREVAIQAIDAVRTDALRQRLLIDRMYWDDNARMRLLAATKLIEFYPGIARQTDAHQVVRDL